MSESNGPTEGDRAFLAEMMSAEHMRKFHAEFMAAHGFPLHQIGEKPPVPVGTVAAGILCEFTSARLRRERVIESARRMFELGRGARGGNNDAPARAEWCLNDAMDFEDAADRFDFEDGGK